MDKLIAKIRLLCALHGICSVPGGRRLRKEIGRILEPEGYGVCYYGNDLYIRDKEHNTLF